MGQTQQPKPVVVVPVVGMIPVAKCAARIILIVDPGPATQHPRVHYGEPHRTEVQLSNYGMVHCAVEVPPRARQHKTALTAASAVIPAEPALDSDPGFMPTLDPGTSIHPSQGVDALRTAIHGTWIPASKPE